MFRKSCIVLALLGASLMVVAQEEQPNPCSYTKCGYGANCELTESGQARCVCPSVCPQYIKPICGSDGVTYGNPCFMKIAACRNKKDVSQKSDGPCPTSGTKSGGSC